VARLTTVIKMYIYYDKSLIFVSCDLFSFLNIKKVKHI